MNSEKHTIKRKIILFSLARMNSTIITRSFAQLLNSKIYNEFLTHFHTTKGYVDFNSSSNEEEINKIKEMIDLANHNEKEGYISIFHEMVGDLKKDQIQFLKNAGFTFVLIVRDPRKQFTSIRRLLPDEQTNDFRNNLEGGWLSIAELLALNSIDSVIFSERYLIDEDYRKTIITSLGHTYNDNMANNMINYSGTEFHDICTITKTWNNSKNLWNGPAEQSSSLKKDTTPFVEEKDLESWELCNLQRALNIYNDIVMN